LPVFSSKNVPAAFRSLPTYIIEHGIPVSCTVPEWFDKLDDGLIEHFGENYRILANERRRRWNKDGLWKFDQL
jgi:hypothetical protein